jgi:replicative DNA helicase
MAIVPVLDLRPPPQDPAPAVAPSNLEAEQALLGALLYDNAAYERLSDRLQARHFYEPFHARLFASIESHIRKGQLADPILLAEEFKLDPAFEELGGLRYLADLVDRAPPAANASDYARAVYELAVRRDLIRIGGDIAVAAQSADAETSARDQIEQAEQQLYALAETGGSDGGFVNFADALRGAVEMAAEAFSRDGGLAGISTGLIDLDQKLGGLHPSDLLILAGRPSMGKTALATNIAFHVARHYAWEPQPDGTRKTVNGGVVAFFSLEMSAEQLSMRLLADVSGVSSDRLRKGEIDASEFGRVRDAALEIQESPMYIDATGGLSIAKMVARSRRLKRSVGLDLIVVDYLQLLTTGGDGGAGRTDNRVQEVSMITQGLKALAKELSVPIIALSQLSRQVEAREDKRPQLSDLRESGSIEQDADCVMFVYRESYYLGRAEPKEGTPEHLQWQEDLEKVNNQAEVIIGKQRHGPIGTVKLSFNADTTKFGNLAREGRFEIR